MVSPLTGLAKTIGKAFNKIFFDAVLTRDVVLPTTPAFDPADPPAPTPVNYPCKALRDSFSAFDRLNTEILTSDVKILILATSINTAPIRNDIITYQGADFSVVRSDIDPANAVWVCQARQ